jgi:hypothetical protein
MPVKQRFVVTKFSGRRAWRRVTKWKTFIMGRDEPRRSCGKKALHRQLSAVCGQKAPAGSTVCQLGTELQKSKRVPSIFKHYPANVDNSVS